MNWMSFSERVLSFWRETLLLYQAFYAAHPFDWPTDIFGAVGLAKLSSYLTWLVTPSFLIPSYWPIARSLKCSRLVLLRNTTLLRAFSLAFLQ